MIPEVVVPQVVWLVNSSGLLGHGGGAGVAGSNLTSRTIRCLSLHTLT